MLYAVRIQGQYFDLSKWSIGDILQYVKSIYGIEVHDFDDLEEALASIGVTYQEFIE